MNNFGDCCKIFLNLQTRSKQGRRLSWELTDVIIMDLMEVYFTGGFAPRKNDFGYVTWSQIIPVIRDVSEIYGSIDSESGSLGMTCSTLRLIKSYQVIREFSDRVLPDTKFDKIHLITSLCNAKVWWGELKYVNARAGIRVWRE